MGYWNATRTGFSLQPQETGLVWGDSPADTMSAAIDRIRAIFKQDLGREPLVGELRAGLEFALMGRDDNDSADTLDEL